MPVFTYKALNNKGAVSQGDIDAADRTDAMRLLDRKGLQPVSIKEATAVNSASAKQAKPAAKAAAKPAAKPIARGGVEGEKAKNTEKSDGLLKMKRAEVVMFTEELSDMLGGGLQLEPALLAMENRQELGNLKNIARRLRQDVRDGMNFSNALRRTSAGFDPLYCSLAAAGEASGALDTILRRQAHYLKTIQELQAKFVLALIYPAFLVLSCIGVSILLVTTLIPQLTSLIKSTPGAKVPLGAELMIGMSNFLSHWWHVITLVLVAAAIFFKAWRDNPDNKATWDGMKLRMPMFGKLISSRFYVQFLETMANLVSNGLPLLRSLELSRDATGNLVMRKQLDTVISQVGDGRSFTKALTRAGVFPPLLIDMVAVGEQTGKIDISLRRAAERYDREMAKDMQRLMALVTPIILVIMAFLIGSMMYLIFTSIFQTISGLNGKH
ncbi:MAG: type II secretion system F family protein [Verrucomicrobia bacterium]|nr:type II secretion system F family protein [Verrucomicrobiota bacterium]